MIEKIDAGEVYLREKFSLSPNGNLQKQMDEKELILRGLGMRGTSAIDPNPIPGTY